jgi:DNA-binding transcriptional LysR family regulator
VIVPDAGDKADVLFATPALVKRWGALKSFEGIPFLTQGDGLAQIPTARWVRGAAKGAVFVLKTDSASAMIKAAEAGVGAVLLPQPYGAVTGLAALKLHPALQKALPPWPIEQLHLVGHRAMRLVPRIAAVWDFLIEGFNAPRSPSPSPASRRS